MALTTHHHLALMLRKEYSYKSTTSLGLHNLLQGELYLYLYKYVCADFITLICVTCPGHHVIRSAVSLKIILRTINVTMLLIMDSFHSPLPSLSTVTVENTLAVLTCTSVLTDKGNRL